jgi:hypothetical protein
MTCRSHNNSSYSQAFNNSVHATKAVSFSLTLGNVQPIATDKADNGDSVLSEVKPFDRDQLVEYEQEYPDLQEIIICVFYSMGGHCAPCLGAGRCAKTR